MGSELMSAAAHCRVLRQTERRLGGRTVRCAKSRSFSTTGRQFFGCRIAAGYYCHCHCRRHPPPPRNSHLFAHLWSWRVVRDIWLGSHQDLHANTRILLHFSQFMLRRQKRYQPYGPWEHIPSSIWTEEEAHEVDEEEEDTFLCQVCGKRDTSECSTCDLYLCRGCMGEHTCDIDVLE